MPSRHRYKCLNVDNCPSYGARSATPVFAAMNSPQPACPHCGSIKLEDWGVAINIMGGPSDNTRNSDRNFRNVADRYGLTDMNNKDGQAVKRAAAPPANMISLGGYQVPASESAQCARLPMSAPIKASVGSVNTNRPAANRPSMRQMTNVVAAHQG